MIRGKQSPVVHVIAYRKNAGDPIQVAVTPDLLDMTQYVNREHTITWKLDTKGFSFPKDEPSIEFTSPGWEKIFSKPQVSASGKKVEVLNRNDDGLAYSYNIHVVEAKTGMRAFLDPTIGNNSR